MLHLGPRAHVTRFIANDSHLKSGNNVARMPVRVFISYTHDSENHRDDVRQLGARLREDGVDARLDRWLPGTPSQGWPAWMEDELEAADFILVICSERYYQRYRNQGDPTVGRGVRWESNLIRTRLYADPTRLSRYIPILGDGASTDHIPDPLRHNVTCYRLANSSYDDLYRFLTGQHSEPLPTLGELRAMPAATLPPNHRRGVRDYERTILSDYLQDLIDRLDTERWPLDPRLGGRRLSLRRDAIDLPAKDVEHGRLTTASRATGFRRLLVLGGPGAGKTWFLSRATIACSERALADLDAGAELGNVKVPLVATVATLRDQPPGPIRERIVAACLPPEIKGRTALAAIVEEHENVVLLLDSLDEATGAEDLLPHLDEIPWSLVLTTRPGTWRNQLQLETRHEDVANVTLEPLEYPAGVQAFVEAWYGDDSGGSGARLLTRLQQANRLRDAARVPLLLAFFCILGPDELEADPDILVERTINRLLHGVWKSGGARSTLPVDHLRAMLRDWAWEASGFDTASVGIPPWSERVDAPSHTVGLTEAAAAALANVCPEVAPPDLDTTLQPRRFVHRVLHEHLVASTITGYPPTEAAAIVRSHLWAADEWREVVTAAIRRHPHRAELCTYLVQEPPFNNLSPDAIPGVDFDGLLDHLLLTFAASTDPTATAPTLRAHVHAARLRLFTRVEKRYSGRAKQQREVLARTETWGIGTEVDLVKLVEQLVPRTGSSIPDRPDLPIVELGLTDSQRISLRSALLPRIEEDDGSFGQVLEVLVQASLTDPEQRDLLKLLEGAWPEARGWRREQLALAYRSVSSASTMLIRRFLIEAIDEDVALGRRLDWGLVVQLGEVERDLAGEADAAARFTGWTAAASRSPYSAHLLARAALDLHPTDEDREILLDAVTEALHLASSPEWLEHEDQFVVEERFVATELCRILVTGVGTREQASRVAHALARIVVDDRDLRTESSASDALADLDQRFPGTPAAACLEVGFDLPPKERLQFRVRARRALAKRLNAEEAAHGLLASGDQAQRDVANLGTRDPDFWHAVQSVCVQAINDADVEGNGGAEVALRVAVALEGQGENVERMSAAVAGFLDRSRDNPVNLFAFTRICNMALGLEATHDELARRFYDVVAHRLSSEEDHSHRDQLVRILTGECRRHGKVPDAMLPVLHSLKRASGDDRQLICAQYEFLNCATPDEKQEFLDLLSTPNESMSVTKIREISRLNWTANAQELLWDAAFRRLSPETEWWRRTSLTRTLLEWAQSPVQRTRIEADLVPLISEFAADSSALWEGGLNALMRFPGQKQGPPRSGLSTRLGEFVRHLQAYDLSRSVLREAHDALVARASGTSRLAARAALFECAGVLLPSGSTTPVDRTIALSLLTEARTEDDSLRAQRALLHYEPTAQDLLDIPSWPAAPALDLLRAARRSSTSSDWYSLLQRLAEKGLLPTGSPATAA